MLDEKDHAYIAALAATIASETARQSDEEVMEVITDVSARLRVAWAHRLQPKFMDHFLGELAAGVMAERAALSRRVN
ncbi:hypothetical protein AUC71_03130 [Methyloceanibacter marginalis]|uniref:Uncharacterized protein n=1 Tax=Methyloceanibacter marginalis TaxID=1774971 RepID=A0A1E3W703_9HYPH|nr:hypothetical protein [Methyloceanibacter marginalis]ODS01546.1 hypothetical protein AUC71_03130 [Methyloceanibacter marginalis]